MSEDRDRPPPPPRLRPALSDPRLELLLEDYAADRAANRTPRVLHDQMSAVSTQLSSVVQHMQQHEIKDESRFSALEANAKRDAEDRSNGFGPNGTGRFNVVPPGTMPMPQAPVSIHVEQRGSSGASARPSEHRASWFERSLKKLAEHWLPITLGSIITWGVGHFVTGPAAGAHEHVVPIPVPVALTPTTPAPTSTPFEEPTTRLDIHPQLADAGVRKGRDAGIP